MNPRAEVTYIRDVCPFLCLFLGFQETYRILAVCLFLIKKKGEIKMEKMTNVLLISGSGNLESG
jgi:hypothetical protein